MLYRLSRIADIFAIPLWITMLVYFASIDNHTTIEWVLLLFAVVGLLADALFTIDFIGSGKISNK